MKGKFLLILLILSVLNIIKSDSSNTFQFLSEVVQDSKFPDQEWKDCDKNEAVVELNKKKIVQDFPLFESNPYNLWDSSKENREMIYKTLNNTDLVCSLKYEDDSKETYSLKTFSTKAESDRAGYIVTHYGRCGSCSTLHDLVLYLTVDMTKKVSWCAFKSLFSNKLAMSCLKNIGFTDSCAQIWLYNSIYTSKNCLAICLYCQTFNIPKIDKNGKLNKCLSCDENKSGPVFKYYSGRTRRNSGIKSEIPRDPREVVKMEHCYYK